MIGHAIAVYFGIMFFVWHLSTLYKDFGWFSIAVLIGELLLAGWISDVCSDDKKGGDKKTKDKK